ncbi:MAG: hypothetical protein V4534_05535 [Myxococcota bacterium]
MKKHVVLPPLVIFPHPNQWFVQNNVTGIFAIENLINQPGFINYMLAEIEANPDLEEVFVWHHKQLPAIYALVKAPTNSPSETR